jgi:RimJ/RimL family protein N-acetyltransferase
LDQLVFNDDECGHAVARLAGTYYNPASCSSICRVRDGIRLGGVVFSNYTGESIAMHSASWHPRWINRDLIYCTFDYPFNQLGVKRIFGQVPEDNIRARKFNQNVGFRTVARVEGVYRGDIACLVMRLDREDCRLLKVKPRMIKSNSH